MFVLLPWLYASQPQGARLTWLAVLLLLSFAVTGEASALRVHVTCTGGATYSTPHAASLKAREGRQILSACPVSLPRKNHALHCPQLDAATGARTAFPLLRGFGVKKAADAVRGDGVGTPAISSLGEDLTVARHTLSAVRVRPGCAAAANRSITFPEARA